MIVLLWYIYAQFSSIAYIFLTEISPVSLSPIKNTLYLLAIISQYWLSVTPTRKIHKP